MGGTETQRYRNTGIQEHRDTAIHGYRGNRHRIRGKSTKSDE